MVFGFSPARVGGGTTVRRSRPPACPWRTASNPLPGRLPPGRSRRPSQTGPA